MDPRTMPRTKSTMLILIMLWTYPVIAVVIVDDDLIILQNRREATDMYPAVPNGCCYRCCYKQHDRKKLPRSHA